MLRAFWIVALVAACRAAPQAPPFTLRIAVSGPLEAVTPSAELKSWTSIAVPLVFEPLLALDVVGKIVPVLASRAEIAGPHSLRIWPRADARFSDGSPITFTEIADSLASNHLHAIAEGDHILVTSDEAGLPTEFQLSRAYVSRREGASVFGTGAFTVEEQDATHIQLTRVVPAHGLIEHVRVISYPSGQDAFAHTLKGDADMLPEVQERWVEFFQGVPRLRVLRAPGPSAYMVGFNRARLTASERRILISVLAADEMRRVAFGADCEPPAQRLEIEPFTAGKPLDILAVPFFDRFAFAVRRQLGSRGGTVELVELQEFVPRVKDSNFDLATLRPRVWPLLRAVLAWHTGAAANLMNYSNPRVDAALDARDWAAAQRALEEDPPGAVVCTPPSLVVLDARIKNATLGYAFMETLPQWQVQQ